MNEENIFSKQSDLMKEALTLFDERISRIKPTANEESNISISDSAIRIFRIKSLKLYRDTLEFLAEEVTNTKIKNYAFLLPQVRTLLDIYAHFLHILLNCPSEAQQALTVITYQLRSFRHMKTEFDKGLEFYKDFLAQEKPDFPKDPAMLSLSWIGENGFNFKNNSELLTPENIGRFSTETIKIFGTNKTYEIYRHFSELLHGNPYVYSPKNERFWVVSMAIMNTSFLVELIDRHILDKGQLKDARAWLKRVENGRKEFVDLWKTKKISA